MSEPRLQSHETRLSDEGWYLYRRLRRLALAAGASLGARDYKAIKLNGAPGFGVSGLATLRVAFGSMKATVMTAPGVYFDEAKPDGRTVLEALANARRADGCRVVLITKHEVTGRAPFDLERAIRRSPRIRPGSVAPAISPAATVEPASPASVDADKGFVPAMPSAAMAGAQLPTSAVSHV